MDVEVLLELSGLDLFISYEHVIILVVHHNQQTSCGTWNDGIHHYCVGSEDIIGNKGWACIHKHWSYQDDKSASHQETDIESGKLPVSIQFIHLENQKHLCFGEFAELRVRFLEPHAVSVLDHSYLFLNFFERRFILWILVCCLSFGTHNFLRRNTLLFDLELRTVDWYEFASRFEVIWLPGDWFKVTFIYLFWPCNFVMFRAIGFGRGDIVVIHAFDVDSLE